MAGAPRLKSWGSHRRADINSYQVVYKYWQEQHKGGDFDAFWRKSLHDGFIAGTTFAPKPVSARAANIPSSQAPASGMEIMFRSDASIFDGRFANNGWLQELPKPITQITWDNPVMMSLRTAGKLGSRSRCGRNRSWRSQGARAVWLTPGHRTIR